ncbi:MAG: hypothetical protein U5K51_14515 [Flavobacteriaceae bacterium]|nr:hypothetical protein [Flavobacteriaceae bacterium]
MKHINAYIAILILIIWTLITLGPNVYNLQGKTQELGAGLGNGPSYTILGAAIFILFGSISIRECKSYRFGF